MKTEYRIVAICLILVIAVSAIGYIVWEGKTKSYQEEHQTALSDVIRNTIHYEVERGALFPELVLIGFDSLENDQLKDSLINRISESLSDRYLNFDKDETV